MPVLAIDPGESIGIAFFDNGYQSCVIKEPAELWTLITGVPWDVVVYENFSTSGRISAPGLHTVRIVGGIQALCSHFHIAMIQHAPQARYPYLRKAKVMLAGHIIHEIDAMAHLLRWEADNGLKGNL